MTENETETAECVEQKEMSSHEYMIYLINNPDADICCKYTEKEAAKELITEFRQYYNNLSQEILTLGGQIRLIEGEIGQSPVTSQTDADVSTNA